MSISVDDSIKSHYLGALESLPPNGSPAWLKNLRASAKAKFAETELPHTRMEEWRQTNIAAINKTSWNTLSKPGPQRVNRDETTRFFYNPGVWHEMVWVDGFFGAGLGAGRPLPSGVFAGSLKEALQGDLAGLAEQHINKYLTQGNAYTALNSAFLLDGAFVHVTKNTRLASPLHLIFVTRRDEADMAAQIRNLIVLEDGAQATILVSYVSLHTEARYLNNVVEEISLGANANLDYYRQVEEGAKGNHLATTAVHHARDSRFRSHAFTMSGAIVRNQLLVGLDGENSECELKGLYMNDGDRLTDNALRITHSQPHCRSRIAYKGILDGKSKAVFAGHVYVHPEAQKTDSDQLSNNLLLSDEATIDAKPQLEIFADDVKCTHGATIGSFPPAVIFYFRSRGIDEATARGMLTYGFADEIVRGIEVEDLAARLDRYVYEKYSPKFG